MLKLVLNTLFDVIHDLFISSLSRLIKKVDETGILDRKVGSERSGNKLGTNQPGLY